MERRAALSRNTPLVAKKGLETRHPLQARSTLGQGGGLKRNTELPRGVPAPRKPSAKQQQRAKTWAAIREEAWEAWGGHCAVGGHPLPYEQCHGHHRLLKSAGGPDTLANCLPVCLRCHERIHCGGDVSYSNGWLVRAWLLPEDVPILGAAA